MNAGQCSPVHIVAIGSGAPASYPASVSATASGVASQIPDGQITGSAVTQIAPITQISDGQIQAPTSTPACNVYVDGQPQCPTSVAPVNPCSVYVDGQPQCPGSTGYPVPSYGANSSIVAPTPSVVPATGAGSTTGVGSALFALAAGALAIALL